MYAVGSDLMNLALIQCLLGFEGRMRGYSSMVLMKKQTPLVRMKLARLRFYIASLA